MPKARRLRAAKAKRHVVRAVHRIDVKLPAGLYQEVQQLMKRGQYFSMSDFGRAAIREKLAALRLGRKR